jgi:hypothetical protein
MSSCAGSEGFTLILEVAGRTGHLEVFLPPAEARALSAFIEAATNDAD